MRGKECMINENGKKYLPIVLGKPVGDTDIWNSSNWSLGYVSDNFSCTDWFSYDDYEVYKPDEIRKKYFKKASKLNVRKLEQHGYEQVIGMTYEEAEDIFFDFLNVKALKRYFSVVDDCIKDELFDEFINMTWIHEEWSIFEDWLRLDLAKKWCEERGIEYKLDIPDDYPQELPEQELRNRIKEKIKETHFKPPFDFLNSYK